MLNHLIPSGNGRRRAGRLEQELMTSSGGRVLDLSATGVRTVTRRAPAIGRVMKLTLLCLGDGVVLDAEVVWRRRTGLFRYEVGYRFVDPTREQQAQLAALAQTGRCRRELSA